MTDSASSPFHAGEQAIQARLGVREHMERFGRQIIRDHLPDQHRAFYRQLPFVLAGHADSEGWPWASLLYGEPGFITSPDPHRLRIAARPVAGDPLAANLLTGKRLGLLGIELHSRRRNRLSAHISAVSDAGIELGVDQAFGNCPQYIQKRSLRRSARGSSGGSVDTFNVLPAAARAQIEHADTFFVASCVDSGGNAASDGVDVSHRGGRPGFLRVDDDGSITVPDYPGNLHFNTLGNFLLNPKAGLLFVDFETGDLLMLTGTVEILWDHPDMEFFDSAERLWRFRLDHGRRLHKAVPLRWSFDEYSPNTRLTGTWQDAAARRRAEAERDAWKDYRVLRVQDESSVIRSFYLQPTAGALPAFEAGQFLTLRLPGDDGALLRTYTVSSAPADSLYRISVKRQGVASSFLHDRIGPGDVLQVRAPVGAFTFDSVESRPAVLLSAGIGITPMMSMLRHAVHEAIRTRHLRPIVFVHAAADALQRPFFSEIQQLVAQTAGQVRYCSVLGRPGREPAPGRDYHHAGRITRELLQSLLPLDDYDYYLCGPPSFMQAMYELLRGIGAPDARIQAEAFGPASLRRRPDAAAAPAAAQDSEAQQALVHFAEAAFEQPWTPQAGTLLEFAEAHGLSPVYGCRSGQCGACRTRVLSGRVAYRHAPQCKIAAHETLLCCAVPAAGDGDAVARLSLSI